MGLISSTNKDRIEWVICDCHSHAVQVMKFAEDGDYTDNLIFLSLWSHGFDDDHRPGFWWRFRCAWRTLWRYNCHGNEIILNGEEARKLSKILVEMADTCKKQDGVIDS